MKWKNTSKAYLSHHRERSVSKKPQRTRNGGMGRKTSISIHARKVLYGWGRLLLYFSLGQWGEKRALRGDPM